jgi:hypothetical protein
MCLKWFAVTHERKAVMMSTLKSTPPFVWRNKPTIQWLTTNISLLLTFFDNEEYIFWDITPCSPFKVKVSLPCFLIQANFLLGLLFYPYLFSRNVGCNINGLRGTISQKIELFITTAVRTSNPLLMIQLNVIDEVIGFFDRPNPSSRTMA